MGTRVIAALALACSLASCSKKQPTPEELEKMVAAERAAMAKLAPAAKVEALPVIFSVSNAVVEKGDGTVEVSAPLFSVKPHHHALEPKLTFTLAIHTGPGSTVEIAGTKVTADAAGIAKFPLDLQAMLVKRLAETLLGDDSKLSGGEHILSVKFIELPVTVTATDGGVRKGAIHFDDLFEKWIAGLKHGPALLEGEVAGPSPRKSVLVILRKGSYASDLMVYGPATKFAEIDMVMFEASELREKSCGPYVDSKGTKKNVPLTVFDKVVRVVERKSGKEIGRRVFTASTACPKTIDGASTGESASVPDGTMVTWVKQLLKK